MWAPELNHEAFDNAMEMELYLATYNPPNALDQAAWFVIFLTPPHDLRQFHPWRYRHRLLMDDLVSGIELRHGESNFKAALGSGLVRGHPAGIEIDHHIAPPVEAGKVYLEKIKRFDMVGFQPRPAYVREMQRYGVLPANLSPTENLDPYKLDEAYWRSFWYQLPSE